MRRLLILASTVVLFDVAFYAAIAPLLPGYVAEFGLSEAEAGVLASAYAAGTLTASLPAGFVATRVGPRSTVISGLLLLGGSSVVFGFGGAIGLLDAARFAQGVSGALIWAGALSWLIGAAPAERRGSVIGTALGTAVAGALLGPLLGAIAAEVGTEAVFGGMLGIAAALAAIAAGGAGGPPAPGGGPRGGGGPPPRRSASRCARSAKRSSAARSSPRPPSSRCPR
jgi:MFS family permease